MRDVAACVLEELEPDRRRGGHEPGLRLHQQRDLRLVEAAHEHEILGHGHRELAPRRQLIDAGERRHLFRAQPDSGIAGHADAAALVLADVFEQLGIGRQQSLALDRERPREHLRIVDGDLVVQVAEVAAAETLGQTERLGLWMSGAVEPTLVVEPGGRDDQRVAFPSSDRVAEPRRVRVLRQIAAVGEDGARRHVR